MAVAALATVSESLPLLVQAIRQTAAQSGVSTLECIITPDGKISILVEQRVIASATAAETAAATEISPQKDSSLSVFRQILELQRSANIKEQIIADITCLSSEGRSGYALHPCQLEASLSMRALVTEDSLVCGTDFLNVAGKCHGRRVQAAAQAARLGLSCPLRRVSLADLLSQSLRDAKQQERNVPAFQTIWQRISIKPLTHTKPLRWLVVSQCGGSLRDYFTM